MKARIHRIVADQCGNPKVGTRWALAVSVLAALIIVAVAVAQPAPTEAMGPEPAAGPAGLEAGPRPEPRGRPDALDPAVAGRRNVLSRLRDQLQLQIAETEANLRDDPDRESVRSQVLRSELATLRGQMQGVERQLSQPGQGQGRNRPEGMRREGPMPQAQERRVAELRQRRQELTQKIERTKGRLMDLDDDQGQEARELRKQIDQINAQLRDVDQQMANIGRSRAGLQRDNEPIEGRIQGQRPEGEGRRQPAGGEMVTTVYKLQYADSGQMQKIIASLLSPAGKVNSDERTGSLIITDLPELHKRIQGVIKELDVQGSAGRRGAGTEVDELRSQVKALKAQIQRMQAALDQMAGQKGKEKPQPQEMKQY